jgi:F-type H+-transporting ATPase subunit epsilon
MALISNRWFQSLEEREGSADSIPAIQSVPPNPLPIPRSLKVSVIAPGPGRLSWQGSAQSVTLPSPSGEFGILTGHASLTTFLDVGVLRMRVKEDQVLALVVLGGFVKVEGDEVTILAAGAERVDGLELRQTFAAVETAKADLNQAKNSSARGEAKKNLKRAYARWQAASYHLSTIPNSEQFCDISAIRQIVKNC